MNEYHPVVAEDTGHMVSCTFQDETLSHMRSSVVGAPVSAIYEVLLADRHMALLKNGGI